MLVPAVTPNLFNGDFALHQIDRFAIKKLLCVDSQRERSPILPIADNEICFSRARF